MLFQIKDSKIRLLLHLLLNFSVFVIEQVINVQFSYLSKLRQGLDVNILFIRNDQGRVVVSFDAVVEEFPEIRKGHVFNLFIDLLSVVVIYTPLFQGFVAPEYIRFGDSLRCDLLQGRIFRSFKELLHLRHVVHKLHHRIDSLGQFVGLCANISIGVI